MIDCVDHFMKTMDAVLSIYRIKNPLYGDCWINDSLDSRALVAELSAKYHRLVNIIWTNWDTIDNDSQRTRAVETMYDMILYLCMLSYRLQHEEGEVDPGHLIEMRDES